MPTLMDQEPINEEEAVFKTDFDLGNNMIYTGQMKVSNVNGEEVLVQHGRGK